MHEVFEQLHLRCRFLPDRKLEGGSDCVREKVEERRRRRKLEGGFDCIREKLTEHSYFLPKKAIIFNL